MAAPIEKDVDRKLPINALTVGTDVEPIWFNSVEWIRNLRKHGFVDAPIYDFLGNGLHRFRISDDNEEVQKWADQFQQEVKTKDKKIKVILEEVSPTAMADAHAQGVERPYNKQTYELFQEWARKWNVTKIQELSYKDMVVGSELEKSEPTSDGVIDIVLKKIVDIEEEVRRVMKRDGYHKFAIYFFIRNQFHNPAWNHAKFDLLQRWALNYNVKEIEKITYEQLVSMPGMIDEDAKITVKAVTDEPIHSTTSDVQEVPTTNVAEEDSAVSNKDNIEETGREYLRSLGFPEEAIDEFLDAGLAHADFEDEEVQQRANAWILRWGPVAEKRMSENPGFDSEEIGKEVLSETAQIFANSFRAVEMMRTLAEYGDNIPMRDYIMNHLNNLPEFEWQLIQKVFEHGWRQAAAKYGFKIPEVSDQRKKEIEDNSI